MAKKEKDIPISTLGGRIRNKRNEKKLTDVQFYDIVKGANNTSDGNKYKKVDAWEIHGKVQPDEINPICDVLGISADYLLGRKKAETPEMESISEMLGLSYSSIKKLQKGKKAICSCPEWIAIPSDLEKDRAKRKAERLLVVLNLIIENDDLSDAIYEYLRIGKDGAKQIVFGKDNSSLHVAGSDQLNIININGVRIDSDIINKAMQDRLINALNEVQRNNDIPAIDYSVFGMTSSGKELTATEIKE